MVDKNSTPRRPLLQMRACEDYGPPVQQSECLRGPYEAIWRLHGNGERAWVHMPAVVASAAEDGASDRAAAGSDGCEHRKRGDVCLGCPRLSAPRGAQYLFAGPG